MAGPRLSIRRPAGSAGGRTRRIGPPRRLARGRAPGLLFAGGPGGTGFLPTALRAARIAGALLPVRKLGNLRTEPSRSSWSLRPSRAGAWAGAGIAGEGGSPEGAAGSPDWSSE